MTKRKKSRFHQDFNKEGTRRHDKLVKRVIQQEPEIMTEILLAIVDHSVFWEKTKKQMRIAKLCMDAYINLRSGLGSSWYELLNRDNHFVINKCPHCLDKLDEWGGDWSEVCEACKRTIPIIGFSSKIRDRIQQRFTTIDNSLTNQTRSYNRGFYYGIKSDLELRREISSDVRCVFKRRKAYNDLQDVITGKYALATLKYFLESPCYNKSFLVGNVDIVFFFHKVFADWDIDYNKPVVVEVKPDIKDYGSVIRQVNAYWQLKDAQLGVIVTYTPVSEEDRKLFFESQGLLLIVLEEKDAEPRDEQTTLEVPK